MSVKSWQAVRKIPLGEPWFEGEVQAKFSVVDVASGAVIDTFDTAGRSIASVSKYDPEHNAQNAQLRTENLLWSAFFAHDVLPEVPLRGDILAPRSLRALENATAEMILSASKRMASLHGRPDPRTVEGNGPARFGIGK